MGSTVRFARKTKKGKNRLKCPFIEKILLVDKQIFCSSQDIF